MAVLGPLRPDEERMFQGQPRGFPLDNSFSVEDVMLPENDDMGIESEDDEVDEAEIVSESGFGSVIVVDNLPQVPPEKQDKLIGVLRKLYDNYGTIREGGLWLPQDSETQVTRGFAFLEYSNPREAHAALQQTNGYNLTKTISFRVTMFDDFERFGKVPDAYEQPERQPYKPQEDLQSWMLDRRARDQFVVRNGDATEVMWNDPQRLGAETVHNRVNWTESYVQWSPHGSYLSTLHRQGVAVWGTSKFTRIHRFAHSMVRLMAFSPNERYLVTHSLVEAATPQDKASMVLNVFDLRLGRCLRNFTGPVDEFAVGTASGAWPIFKWAGHAEDKYFARMGKGRISV